MKLNLTRDSVAAGDDIDAPHFHEMEVDDLATVEDIARELKQSDYLATIFGGHATWSLASSIPLAVIAQQWREPKVIVWNNPTARELSGGRDSLSLHLNYHAQQDPDEVFETLRRFMTASG